MTTYVLTGSPENFDATRDHGFTLLGLKERRRNQAEALRIGDRVIFYLTRESTFAGSVLIAGELYEDRTPVWPGKPGNPDPYPWRFATKPEVVLADEDRVPAVELAGALEHVAKWPIEHWTLAFQGQIRAVSSHDASLVMDRMGAEAAAGSPRGVSG